MRHLIIRSLILLVFFITLISCATQKKINQNYQFNSTDEEGLVLATITIKNYSDNIDVLNLSFKDFYDVHDTNWFLLNLVFKNNRIKPDTIVNDEKIYYMIGKRPPTKYKLYDYEIIKNLNSQDNIKPITDQISIPFEIEKGIVNYIGNFNFYLNKNQNGFHFEVRNNLDRDFIKLKLMYPKVEFDNIKSQLLKSKEDVIEF